ncbi:MAG TPA: hypothetical protein VNQ73_15825 [Ilumatobacter sp.]|nr:hypothetical protein [Ilumatobacter sp.]
MSRPSFHKRDREKARRERAVAKAAKREERRNNPDEPAEPLSAAEQDAILAELAELHRRFEAEQITFEDFDDAKRELTRRLEVS